MSEAYVVDASMAFAWIYPSQASAEADALLESVRDGTAVVAAATRNGVKLFQRAQR